MPTVHEHDSLSVTNIDLKCTDIEEFVVDQSMVVPPTPGEVNPMNIPQHRSQRVSGSFDHSQYFEVRYNGQPFRIPPGETRVWPRYIAEHFAKHLADHMLIKLEDAERIKAEKEGRSPKTGYLQSVELRPQMLDKILKVEQYFLADGQQAPNPPVSADIPGVSSHDLGAVPNYALGDLKPQPKTADEILSATDTPPVENPMSQNVTPPTIATDTVAPGPVVEAPNIGAPVAAPAATDTPMAPVTEPEVPEERTKSELIREAVTLGIEVTGRESADQLKEKIKAFA